MEIFGGGRGGFYFALEGKGKYSRFLSRNCCLYSLVFSDHFWAREGGGVAPEYEKKGKKCDFTKVAIL